MTNCSTIQPSLYKGTTSWKADVHCDGRFKWLIPLAGLVANPKSKPKRPKSESVRKKRSKRPLAAWMIGWMMRFKLYLLNVSGWISNVLQRLPLKVLSAEISMLLALPSVPTLMATHNGCALLRTSLVGFIANPKSKPKGLTKAVQEIPSWPVRLHTHSQGPTVDHLSFPKGQPERAVE